MTPIVHPGDDEIWIANAIKYLGKTEIDRAETCAMIVGLNCAHLKKHTMPPVFAKYDALASKWHWAHRVGLKGLKQRTGPAQGRLF